MEAESGHQNVKSQPIRQDVQVQLQYLAPDPSYKETKPFQIVPDWADIERRSNVLLAPGPAETIRDVSGEESSFDLDENGFKFVSDLTTLDDWTNRFAIRNIYYPALERLLRHEVDGCDEILFYDSRLRQNRNVGVKIQGMSLKPFARKVHTDNTEPSVIAKVCALTKRKAEYCLAGRVRVINIWRPIKHPVFDCSLAVADGSCLQDGDVIECDRIRKDTGEHWDTMGVLQYRPGFDWWYKFRQGPHDVLLFKTYDSSRDVKARWCPHTAFDLPPQYVPAGSPGRESVEVRALIFTHPKDITSLQQSGSPSH